MPPSSFSLARYFAQKRRDVDVFVLIMLNVVRGFNSSVPSTVGGHFLTWLHLFSLTKNDWLEIHFLETVTWSSSFSLLYWTVRLIICPVVFWLFLLKQMDYFIVSCERNHTVTQLTNPITSYLIGSRYFLLNSVGFLFLTELYNEHRISIIWLGCENLKLWRKC